MSFPFSWAGSTVLTPPTPPISQSPAAMEASPPRTIAAWPAESHVFGAAQAVIGKATIGPHITPQFKTLPFSSPAETVQKNSPIITSSFPAPSGQNNSGKLNNGISTLVNAGTEEEDDVFGGTLQSPKDQRKRVFDLLNISRSRKSSLYTNTTTSSYQSSGTNTPVNLPLSRNYTGKPKLEEAILNFPENILAGILDYMSFRSFKKLLFSSPKLYRAAYNDVNGQSKFMEVVKQRFLAPYGYLPLPSSSKSASSNKNIKKNNIHFTMRDLNTFQIGIEYSLSEYSIFASEHLRKPLKPSIIKIIRESTRSFNKLAFRLQFQSHFITSLYLLPQSSTPKTHIIGEDIQEEGERIVPRLIKPHWVNYKRIDQQNQVFKEGRCISLRVWIPCQSHWMTDEEIVQVEKELHKVGIWKYLRKGDLVRNVALGDIANEGRISLQFLTQRNRASTNLISVLFLCTLYRAGILIFDGKYFRDLSYNFDIIGHLPSWVNSLTFSPSYFHNQIASSTSDPIVYLDLTPWKSTIQSNLLLCKEKVDMTSPSGEQYKITRYIYRTVIELIPGAIIRDSTNKGELRF